MRYLDRARQALCEAVLPVPDTSWPRWGGAQHGLFWSSFDTAAPLHLKLAMGATALVMDVIPLGMGYGRTFGGLEPARRQAVVGRLAHAPVVGDLLEVAKIVACFAYFEDESVQRHARNGARGRRDDA